MTFLNKFFIPRLHLPSNQLVSHHLFFPPTKTMGTSNLHTFRKTRILSPWRTKYHNACNPEFTPSPLYCKDWAQLALQFNQMQPSSWGVTYSQPAMRAR